MKIRGTIAVGLLVIILAMLAFIIVNRLGGDEALFLIIGHAAAWAEMIVIFYFRKKPRTED